MDTPRTTIHSKRAPAPVGPYSQAVKTLPKNALVEVEAIAMGLS